MSISYEGNKRFAGKARIGGGGTEGLKFIPATITLRDTWELATVYCPRTRQKSYLRSGQYQGRDQAEDKSGLGKENLTSGYSYKGRDYRSRSMQLQLSSLIYIP